MKLANSSTPSGWTICHKERTIHFDMLTTRYDSRTQEPVVGSEGVGWAFSSEGLFLQAIQDGLDPLHGLLAGLPDRLLPPRLHRVKHQQFLGQQLLQVAVALLRFFTHKLIDVLLEQADAAQDLLDRSHARVVAQGLGPYRGWGLGAWRRGLKLGRPGIRRHSFPCFVVHLGGRAKVYRLPVGGVWGGGRPGFGAYLWGALVLVWVGSWVWLVLGLVWRRSPGARARPGWGVLRARLGPVLARGGLGAGVGLGAGGPLLLRLLLGVGGGPVPARLGPGLGPRPGVERLAGGVGWVLGQRGASFPVMWIGPWRKASTPLTVWPGEVVLGVLGVLVLGVLVLGVLRVGGRRPWAHSTLLVSQAALAGGGVGDGLLPGGGQLLLSAVEGVGRVEGALGVLLLLALTRAVRPSVAVEVLRHGLWAVGQLGVRSWGVGICVVPCAVGLGVPVVRRVTRVLGSIHIVVPVRVIIMGVVARRPVGFGS